MYIIIIHEGTLPYGLVTKGLPAGVYSAHVRATDVFESTTTAEVQYHGERLNIHVNERCRRKEKAQRQMLQICCSLGDYNHAYSIVGGNSIGSVKPPVPTNPI